MQVRLNAFMDSLAKRLKFVRNQRKMTQDDLSEASGVKQSDLSKLERGKSLKTANLVQLAKALRCNPEWLDTGDGNMDLPFGIVPDGPLTQNNDPDAWHLPLITKKRYDDLPLVRQIAVQLKMREALEKEESEVRAEMPKQANG